MGFRKLAAVCAMSVFSSAAMAEDVALVLANNLYDRLPNIRTPMGFGGARWPLERAGFQVISERDGKTRELHRAADRFAALANADDTDRLVVVLSGHFVTSRGQTWLLGNDAQKITGLNAGANGVTVEGLARVLATRAGQSVLVLVPSRGRFDTGAYLKTGVAKVKAPQGVTLITSDARNVQRVVDGLMTPGTSYRDLANSMPSGVTMSGFLSGQNGFTAAHGTIEPARPGELAYWNAVRDIGTSEALEAYLRRYPNGDFADEARRILEEANDPLKIAEQTESDLALSRNARRRIQENLQFIGFNPRGVDGLFGRGTRSAIRDWQRSKGFEVHGFLDAAQIAELDRDAQAQRRKLEREDRQYWRETGALGTEGGYRRYLERYPQGLSAELAREGLAEYNGARESEDWAHAREVDTLEAYQGYLRDYPDGPNAPEARERAKWLLKHSPTEQQIAQARAEERRIANNPVARLLAEQRLAQLGYDTGKVDGKFTDRTRDAIKAVQQKLDLPMTGYISNRTANYLINPN